MDSILLLGIRINLIDREQLIDEIVQRATRRTRSIIANVNVHALNLAAQNAALATFFNQSAAIVFCDGFGVRLGTWLAGQPLPPRNTPPDFIDALCERCIAQDLGMYLLGDTQDVITLAAEKLQSKHTNLHITGFHHGFFPSDEDGKVVDLIEAAKPDILLIGTGMPKQELWLQRNFANLSCPVALPVGALFSYVSGAQIRASHVVTAHGFEWLARLLAEPKRLWRRYLIGNPLFLARVIRERVTGAGTKSRP